METVDIVRVAVILGINLVCFLMVRGRMPWYIHLIAFLWLILGGLIAWSEMDGRAPINRWPLLGVWWLPLITFFGTYIAYIFVGGPRVMLERREEGEKDSSREATDLPYPPSHPPASPCEEKGHG